jgi:MFS family permease
MPVLLLGRVLGGVGVGILSAVVPVYIAELSPEHFRGALSTLWQVLPPFSPAFFPPLPAHRYLAHTHTHTHTHVYTMFYFFTLCAAMPRPWGA